MGSYLQGTNARGVAGGQPVLSLHKVGKEDIPIAGGKGASLGEMLQVGLPVPPGFVVTAAAYRQFMDENQLYRQLGKHLDHVDVNNTPALQEAATRSQSIIRSAPMPRGFRAAIKASYVRMGQGLVAVRSSATAEDLPFASFAGQQRTFLNVQGPENLIEAVQACWASLYEARAIFYRETHGFRHEDVSIAVVVQQMVPADASGVMFTADPSTGSRDVLLIEAIYGLGEPLVSGELSPDAYLVDKAELKVLTCEVVSQERFLRLDGSEHGFESGSVWDSVPSSRQKVQKLSDQHIIELAQLGLRLEQHYGSPQDVEWALLDSKLYIVQSRAITTLDRPSQPASIDGGMLTPVATGAPASPGVAAGRVQVVRSAAEISLVEEGDVLVAEMTTPDFVPAMVRAAAIVTDRGGRTCHAAIISREMGIPCVVGTGNATSVLSGLPMVTADGGAGKVYEGDMVAILQPSQVVSGPTSRVTTRTKMYVNLASPDAAERVAALDVDGVGLLRAEFIIAHIGEHPRAMVEAGRGAEFTSRLAEGLGIFARAFAPRPVVYRFSDFKTNEYRNLKGGEAHEIYEENPMLGYRGCARYLAEPDLFFLEVEAVKQVREQFPSLWVMLPFVRTVEELQGVKSLLEASGLRRSPDFKLWMMLEVPANVLLLDEFLDAGVDGVSIGSNDLTQLILGVDRDSEKLASIFDERNPAVLRALERVITGCNARGVTVSICGQAPSVYPELTRQLVSWGITSISVAPDVIQETRSIIHAVEVQS